MQSVFRPLLAVLFGVLAALAGGCGDPRPPGGSGRLEAKPGAPPVLVLEGSPYEMGWWQGHLLKDRIRTLHPAWRDELRAALTPGEQGGAGGAALRRAIDVHVDLCVDQTIHRLSENMLQELEGMAAGCGLTKEGLIRLEVMRDALRMKGMDPRLWGSVGLAAEPGGYTAGAYWTGPDVAGHRKDLLVIKRVQPDGSITTVVTWPGSLGGIAGVNDTGVGYVSAEGRVSQEQAMGFGGGRPLTIAAREALDDNDRGYDLLAQVTGTMGHAFLAFSMRRDRDDPAPRVEAIGAFKVYAAIEPPWILDDARYMAVGPYEVLDHPDAKALQAAIRQDPLTPEEFWLRVALHAADAGTNRHTGPHVSIYFKDGTAGLVLAASEKWVATYVLK